MPRTMFFFLESKHIRMSGLNVQIRSFKFDFLVVDFFLFLNEFVTISMKWETEEIISGCGGEINWIEMNISFQTV